MSDSGWQPIETAPKDGTDVLLYCPNPAVWDVMLVGHWWEAEGVWALPALPKLPSQISFMDITGEFADDDRPTHWQPLPSPPVPP